MAPTHARFSRDVVLFTKPDRPLARTPKGTLSRAASLAAYLKDIDGMYEALDQHECIKTELGTLASMYTKGDVERWLKTRLESLLDRDIDIEADLFQQGLDRCAFQMLPLKYQGADVTICAYSLTATFLLRELKHALGSSLEPQHQQIAKSLVQETIFRNPTISQLSNIVLLPTTVLPTATSEDAQEENIKLIQRLIQKYDPVTAVKASPKVRSLSVERIVVTGTTGGLGSYLLAQLVGNDRVERVWALNRKPNAGGKSLHQRQLDSFNDKSLDTDLLYHPKLVLLESDLTEEKLGLSEEVYYEVSTYELLHALLNLPFEF